jgi:hypothetical protein
LNNPYNVFISWSGATSRAVATALRDWLPQVINAINPWMSSEDIEKGGRWFSDMTGQLKDIKLGILCLTPNNLEAPWILFEAGALSKTVEGTFVCPFLFRLESSELKGPLAQFQATKAEKEETRKLLRTINRAIQNPTLTDTQLDKAFNKWWEDLEKALKVIPASAEKPRPTRTDTDMLEEILALVRDLGRQSRQQHLESLQKSLLGELTPEGLTESALWHDFGLRSAPQEKFTRALIEAVKRVREEAETKVRTPTPASPPSVAAPNPVPDVEPVAESAKTPLAPESAARKPPSEAGKAPSNPDTTAYHAKKRLRFKLPGK